eukprot:scaffold23390_cov74-Phaeocystis_antarctica.AAC.5
MAASLLVLVVEIIPLPRRAAWLVATSKTVEEAVASHMFCPPPLSSHLPRGAQRDLSATHALRAALAKEACRGGGGVRNTRPRNIILSILAAFTLACTRTTRRLSSSTQSFRPIASPAASPPPCPLRWLTRDIYTEHQLAGFFLSGQKMLKWRTTRGYQPDPG